MRATIVVSGAVMSNASAPGNAEDGTHAMPLEESAEQIRAVLEGQRELSRMLKELKEGLCQVVAGEAEDESAASDVHQETVQLMQRLNSLNPVFEAIDKNLKEIESCVRSTAENHDDDHHHSPMD